MHSNLLQQLYYLIQVPRILTMHASYHVRYQAESPKKQGSILWKGVMLWPNCDDLGRYLNLDNGSKAEKTPCSCITGTH